MTRQIPWLRVFVEGVVIVGSILLALALDAWWDGVQERAEEQEILRGLEVDFAANLAQLEATVRTHEGNEHLIFRLESMSDVELAAVPRDSVGQFVFGMLNMLTFDARDGTLDGVLASGRLILIDDSRLRDLLVEWKSGVEDAKEEAGELRAVATRVIERMTALGGPWSGDTPWPIQAWGIPSLAEALSHLPSADLTVAANDAELMAIVREKRLRAVIYLGQLVPLAEHGDSVLALIEANRR